MKRAVLISAVFFSACNWDAAERNARCVAGEISCDAGSTDAGATDAGSGAIDAGNFDIDGSEPNGLYPFGEDGVWLVSLDLNRATIHTFLRGTLSSAFEVNDFASAYANPEVSDSLLVATVDGGAFLLDEGGVRTTITGPGFTPSLVSLFVQNGSFRTSFWSGNSTYRQTTGPLSEASLLSMNESPCSNLHLEDVEVLPVAQGGSAVIAWRGSCESGGTQSIGISSTDDSFGYQTITPDDARDGGTFGGAIFGISQVRVGAGEEKGETVTQSLRTIDWGPVGESRIRVTSDGLLSMGDVSHGQISAVASGTVSFFGGFTLDAGSEPTLAILDMYDPTRSVLFARDVPEQSLIPVLVRGPMTYVLYAVSSGQLRFSVIRR